MRLLTALSIVLSATLTALAIPAAAQEVPVCAGNNLYTQLQADNPAMAASINAAAAQQPFGKGVFFKVEKSGVAPSTIMGTMHITDPRLADLPDQAAKALDRADVLALEIAEIIEPEKMTALSMQNMGKMMYLTGETLDDKLNAEEIAPVKTRAEAAGMPWNVASKMRPFFLMATLSLPACERQRTAAGKKFLDYALGDRAKAQGKPIVGLETLAEQMDAVASLPEDKKLKSLVDATRLADKIPDMFETMVALYLEGETGLIWSLMHATGPEGFTTGQSRTDYSDFQRVMIDKRNETMANGSAKLIDKGNAFIAVGALHLPGERGLLNILAQRGYTVTKL